MMIVLQTIAVHYKKLDMPPKSRASSRNSKPTPKNDTKPAEPKPADQEESKEAQPEATPPEEEADNIDDH